MIKSARPKMGRFLHKMFLDLEINGIQIINVYVGLYSSLLYTSSCFSLLLSLPLPLPLQLPGDRKKTNSIYYVISVG